MIKYTSNQGTISTNVILFYKPNFSKRALFSAVKVNAICLYIKNWQYMNIVNRKTQLL